MLFGAPGTGKSTYAQYLSQKLSLPWISTGNLFRDLAQTDSRIKAILDAGQLVPDEEVNRIILIGCREQAVILFWTAFPER